jgi:hypothetical protein
VFPSDRIKRRRGNGNRARAGPGSDSGIEAGPLGGAPALEIYTRSLRLQLSAPVEASACFACLSAAGKVSMCGVPGIYAVFMRRPWRSGAMSQRVSLQAEYTTGQSSLSECSKRLGGTACKFIVEHPSRASPDGSTRTKALRNTRTKGTLLSTRIPSPATESIESKTTLDDTRLTHWPTSAASRSSRTAATPAHAPCHCT